MGVQLLQIWKTESKIHEIVQMIVELYKIACDFGKQEPLQLVRPLRRDWPPSKFKHVVRSNISQP